MNCQEFEKIIGGLARATAAHAAARERQLSHAAECARCARRLADEQRLTAGLRALALSDREREAPARVEAALRQAFRARASKVSALAAPPPSRRIGARSLPALGAIAAALALLATGASVASLWRYAPAPPTEDAPVVAQEANAERDLPPAALAPPAETQSAIETPATPQTEQAMRLAPSNRSRRSARQTRGRALQSRAGQELAANDASRAGVAESAGEVATEYLPLVPGGGATSTDAAQIVRVELPRSALTLFGLPVSAGRADERVRADVVLGYDGVARAIRFVR